MALPPEAWCRFFFWFSLAAVFYTFLGYPLLIGLLARCSRHPAPPPQPATPPRVTALLIVHNEAERIAGRIRNLLAADYPAELLDLLVVSDGSTDETVARAEGIGDPRVTVVRREHRSGKAGCLNVAVPAARGELVVLADVRQSFAPHTIRRLAANFADPALGAVSGALEIDPAVTGAGRGVDLYWRLEKFIRASEGRWHSTVGATGAVYAIRRALFQPIPDDTILDDVVLPMEICARGHRVAFDSGAPAFDPQASDPVREQRRKQRTLAGNFQMLSRYPAWLLPGGHPLWWQLISHKYSRLTAPVFLVLLLAANLALARESIYCGLLVAQGLFYALALAGHLIPAARWKIFSVPAGFVFLNLMTVGGFWNYLRGTYRQGKW